MNSSTAQTPQYDLKSFLAGVAIGGLVAAAGALLTAPQSGKRTQEQIRRKGLEIQEQAQEVLDEARHQAELALWEAQLKARQLKHNATVTAQNLQHEGQKVLEEQKQRVGALVGAWQPGAHNGPH